MSELFLTRRGALVMHINERISGIQEPIMLLL